MGKLMGIRDALFITAVLGAAACLPVATAHAASTSAQLRHQAAAGEPSAEVKLGLKLATAKKKADSIRAMSLFRRAYAQGDPDGAWYLGNAYSSAGIGVTPNLMKAKHWMRLGINGSGNRMVAYALQLPALDRGTKQNGYKAKERWLSRAAESGSTVGMVLLAEEEAGMGVAHQPRGVPLDRDAAKQWMRRAARAGNVDAQVLFGDGMIRGAFGSANVDTGLHWLRQAANRGSGQAAGLMAMYLMTGDSGVPKNLHAGLQWATKAAQRHNAFGYFLLGEAAQQGVGETPDPAAALYDFAAARRVDTAHSLPSLGNHISATEATLSHAQVSQVLARVSKISIQKSGDSLQVDIRTVPPGWAR